MKDTPFGVTIETKRNLFMLYLEEWTRPLRNKLEPARKMLKKKMIANALNLVQDDMFIEEEDRNFNDATTRFSRTVGFTARKGSKTSNAYNSGKLSTPRIIGTEALKRYYSKGLTTNAKWVNPTSPVLED